MTSIVELNRAYGAARYEHAWRLRARGMTLAVIGIRLGVSKNRAMQMVRKFGRLRRREAWKGESIVISDEKKLELYFELVLTLEEVLMAVVNRRSKLAGWEIDRWNRMLRRARGQVPQATTYSGSPVIHG